MHISVLYRDPDEKGVVLNNQVASVFLKLPVSESDLKTRFKKTKRRMDRLKVSGGVVVLVLVASYSNAHLFSSDQACQS